MKQEQPGPRPLARRLDREARDHAPPFVDVAELIAAQSRQHALDLTAEGEGVGVLEVGTPGSRGIDRLVVGAVQRDRVGSRSSPRPPTRSTLI